MAKINYYIDLIHRVSRDSKNTRKLIKDLTNKPNLVKDKIKCSFYNGHLIDTQKEPLTASNNLKKLFFHYRSESSK